MLALAAIATLAVLYFLVAFAIFGVPYLLFLSSPRQRAPRRGQRR